MTDEELREMMAKLAASQVKTDELFRQTEEQMKRTDEQMKRTDEQIKRTDEQMKKTDAKLERMGIQLGNINQNIGYTTEEYFYNSLFDNPMLGNIKFDTISRNLHWKDTIEDEFDIVMYNGNSVAIVECKYKAHKNDLLKLMTKKVENFRTISEKYKNYTIYLGLASFYFYPELEQLAHENGVAILKQKGEVVQVDADYLKAY